MRRTARLFMLLLLLIGLPLQAAAQDATPEASPATEGADLLAALGYPTLAFTATDSETLELPEGEITAGRYLVEFTNGTDAFADLEFFMLPEGATMDELAAAFEAIEAFFTDGSGELPDLLFELVSNGGASAMSGVTGHVVLDLTPGTWVTNLYIESTGTNVPFEIEVTGEMPELIDPESVTTVSLFEMDFAVEGDLAIGPQLLRLANTGEMPHHLILSSVPEGTTEDDVIALATSFMGPPASPEASPAAAAEPALSFEDVQDVFFSLPLSAGQHNIVQLDLAPGTYAMICFLPDMDGVPHVVQGMVEIVVVE